MLARAAGAICAALFALATAAVQAQSHQQFVPANFCWAGPYAAGASGMAAGMLDYLKMLNARDGGVNGVRFTWEKCETGYDEARGVACYERAKRRGSTGATLVHPLSTGIATALIERATADQIPIVSIGYGRADAAYGRVFPYVFPLIATYWDLAAAMVRYVGGREGGFDRLRGKKIALLHHDSAYGREPIAVLADLAARYGYDLTAIAVRDPADEQRPQWLRIRALRPDWVILWGHGAMNAAALKGAARIGYPRSKMVGTWWSGAEEDVLPAGRAAKGFVAAAFGVPGTGYPVLQAIRKHVYEEGEGEMADPVRIGSAYYNRGVVFGIVTAEAVRVAQERFGTGRPVSGRQVQWALEHLDIDAQRLDALGALGFMPPLETSCADHAGSGAVRFMQWDGGAWRSASDWMAPAPEDAKLLRAKYERSALRYARQAGITPRRCPNSSS